MPAGGKRGKGIPCSAVRARDGKGISMPTVIRGELKEVFYEYNTLFRDVYI